MGRSIRLALMLLALAWTVSAPAASTDGGFTPSELGALRQYLLSHPDRVPRLVQARPVFQNDRLVGYRIQPGPEPELFHRLGFEPGDIVTHVNGTPLLPANRLFLIGTVSFAPRVTVTLIRDGQRRTMKFLLR